MVKYLWGEKHEPSGLTDDEIAIVEEATEKR